MHLVKSQAGTELKQIAYIWQWRSLNSNLHFEPGYVGFWAYGNVEHYRPILQSESMAVRAVSRTPYSVLATEKLKRKLQSLREDSVWTDVRESCRSDADKIQIDSPSVRRQRRPPIGLHVRYDQIAPRHHQFSLTYGITYLKLLYYHFLDTVIGIVAVGITCLQSKWHR